LKNSDPKEAIKAELENTRSRFHNTLHVMSGENWYKQSLAAEWTNGQVLFHMALGFMILSTLLNLILFFGRLPRSWSRLFSGLLNAGTRLFIRVDILGPRLGAKLFHPGSLGRKYDRAHASLLKKLDSLKEADLERGMYYPTRWDPLMKEFMTVEDVFHYMTTHFNHHLDQLS
jgi:hypothetical protein